MHAQDALPTKADFDLLPLSFLEFTDLPQVWDKTETLGSRLDFRTEWEEWEAVRELVQNAMDASPTIKLLYETPADISYIVDNGKGIIKGDLLLGETKRKTKFGIHCLRGTYGEGLKFGIIALMRRGHKIIIRTVDYDYHFSMQSIQEFRGKGIEQEQHNYQQLHWFRKPNQVDKGTVIAVSGVNCLKYRNRFVPFVIEDQPDKLLLTVKADPKAIAEAREMMSKYQSEIVKLEEELITTPNKAIKSNLEMYRELHSKYEDIWLEHCKVRQVFDLPDVVYVRDIYVQNVDFSYFGYNFWFDDTKDALPPNRNSLGNYYYLHDEFEMILKSRNRDFLRIFFERLYQSPSHMMDRRKSLEWMCLSGQKFKTITTEEALELYTIIFSLVGDNFGWSRDVSEQKLLEHHQIIDLAEKLPDLREPLVRHNLIKDPKDLARSAELLNQTIIITPDEIRLSNISDAEEIATALLQIYQELNCIIDRIQKRSRDQLSILHFYGGNFKSDDEKIGGYYRRSTDEIFIHIKNLSSEEDLLRVLIHELAHASCNDCQDVTAEFITALQSIAAKIFKDIRRGECDFDKLAHATDVIDCYKSALNAYVLEKSLKISNPKGILRPPAFEDDSKDKALIDDVMLRIANDAYADFDNIRPILLGYTSSGNYELNKWNTRGKTSYTGSRWADVRKQPLTDQQIFELDIKTLLQLGFSLPKKALNGTLNPAKWNSLINYPWSEAILLDSDWQIEGEDWNDPSIMIRLILEHPQPYIKARNFAALMHYINPQQLLEIKFQEAYKQLGLDENAHPLDLPEDLRIQIQQEYRRGTYANHEWLQHFHEIAPRIATLRHPAQNLMGEDPYSYPFKERVLKQVANFEWFDILQLFKRSYTPHLRKLLVEEYAEARRWSDILDMEITETDPEVLKEIIMALSGATWYGKPDEGLEPTQFITFFKERRSRYNQIIEEFRKIDILKHRNFYLEDFINLLQNYDERIQHREQYGPKRIRRYR